MISAQSKLYFIFNIETLTGVSFLHYSVTLFILTISPTEYPKTLKGVLDLVEDFDVEKWLKLAKPEVKEMVRQGTLAIPDWASISGNTTKFLNFYINQAFFGFFEEEIGFANTTHVPGIAAAKDLVTRIAEWKSGLLDAFNPETQQVEDTGLRYRLKRRLYNLNLKRNGPSNEGKN